VTTRALAVAFAVALGACGGSAPPSASPRASAAVESQLVRRIYAEIDAAGADREGGMDDRAAARLRALVDRSQALLERAQDGERNDVNVALSHAWSALAHIHATLGDAEGRINALFQAMVFADGTALEPAATAAFLTQQAALSLSRPQVDSFARIAVTLAEAEQLALTIVGPETSRSVRSQILNVRLRTLITFVALFESRLEAGSVADLPPPVHHYLRFALRAVSPPRDPTALQQSLAPAEVAWLDGRQPLKLALLAEALKLNAVTVALDQQRFVGMGDRVRLVALEVAKDWAQEADILERMGDPVRALKRAGQALAVFDEHNMFEDAVIERSRIVRLLEGKDASAALVMSSKLIAQIEAKTGALSGRSMSRFLRQFAEVYDRHYALLLGHLTQGQGGASASALEQLILHADRSNFRATRRDFTLYRELGERIAHAPNVRELIDAQRTKLLERGREVDRALAQGKGPDDAAYSPAPGTRVDDPFRQLTHAKREFIGTLEDVKRRMLGAATARSGLVANLGEVRQGMTGDDAIVFYFRDPGASGTLRAAVIGADGSQRLTALRGSVEETAALVGQVREAIILAEIESASARKLADMIWQPLGPLPRNLTVVLNPELAGVPFEALPGRSSRPVVLDHTIRYAFGLSQGAGARDRPDGIANALVAGAERFGTRDLDPLPSTREELEDVRSLLAAAGAKVEPVEPLPERGRSLFSRTTRYDLMLLSTHSIVDPNVPMADVLAFPQDDVDAWSLAFSPVRARVVVLSACELMRYRSLDGDPVSGVATASLARVSPRLVSALWNVDAEAARLFVARLTSRLIAKEDVGSALAAVKRDFATGRLGSVAAGRDFRAPYFWAPLVLAIGSGG
jgi:hypothetical protein